MSLRAGLCGLAALICLAGPASAAAPPAVDARAWLVENAGTGDLLLAHDGREHLAIASITKLMTVLVALDHLRLSDVVTVDPRVTSVGEESIALRPGEQLTVADLVRGALIQSANDAADALALATAPDYAAFAEQMNAKAKALGLRDSHFVRPDGLDAPGEFSSARDVTELARAAMRNPFIRRTVRRPTAEIAGGRTLHTWNDLLGVIHGVIGVKTGHTGDAGWSQVAAQRTGAATIYATILGSPTRSRRNGDLAALLAWGLDQYRQVDAIVTRRPLATVGLPYGRAPLELVSQSGLRTFVRLGRSLTERVVAPAAVSLPVHRGQILGRVEIWSGARLVGRRNLVASRSVSTPGLAGRVGWYARRTVHHVVGLF
jgi:serine-type D-Ala-D-Ala carboxypeptidase (penicillin-binding protein 5/6)